jgi:hypothetical protein
MPISKRTPTVVVILGLLLVVALAGWFGRQQVIGRLRDRVKPGMERLVRAQVEDVLKSREMTIAQSRQMLATESTARFIEQHLPLARTFSSDLELLEFCVNELKNGPDGLYCEFGVYKGRTINHVASLTEKQIHGFDSFEGLPEDWRAGFRKGFFAMTGLPEVRENIKLHKGWFSDSLPSFKKEHPGPVVFLHMDADLYSSTKDVFDALGDRIPPGAIIDFDEFFNYPGWEQGEAKAFREFVDKNNVEFEYLGYCDGTTDEQLAVRILRNGAYRH